MIQSESDGHGHVGDRRIAPGLARDMGPYLRLAAQMVYRNPLFMVAPELREPDLRLPGVEVFRTVEQATAAASELLEGKEQRVVVFPAGGGTYPILASTARTLGT